MNKARAIKNSLEKIDSEFIKALTEPARLDILKLLILNGPSDVKSLAAKMPQDRSVVSRHLALMKKAGLLSVHKEGRHVFYSIDGETAIQKSEQLVQSIRECYELGCC